MYEQYTDKQIVEMLIPKMNKCSERTKWDVQWHHQNKRGWLFL